MSQKVNVILVGRNEPDIISQFMEILAEKGGSLINIVQEYRIADMEVDITNYKGTTNLYEEVNFILNASITRAKMLKKQKKLIKIQNTRINETKKKIKSLQNGKH